MGRNTIIPLQHLHTHVVSGCLADEYERNGSNGMDQFERGGCLKGAPEKLSMW